MANPIHRPLSGAIPEAGRLGQWIVRFGIIFALGILLAMAILVVEVFLRYVLNQPTIWAHETTIFLCAIAFIYGGLYDVARNTHIRVVLIYDYLNPQARRLMNIIISCVSMVACLFFTWAAWLMVKKSTFMPNGDFRLETSGSAWNPPTPGLLKLFFFTVMLITAIQFFILAVSYWRERMPTQTASKES